MKRPWEEEEGLADWLAVCFLRCFRFCLSSAHHHHHAHLILQQITIKLAGRDAFCVRPAAVRRADTSAAAIDEWTGERLAPANVSEEIKPLGIAPVGNYAVQITWDDGFNQVAPFEVLAGLEAEKVEAAAAAAGSSGGAAAARVEATVGGLQATAEISG